MNGPRSFSSRASILAASPPESRLRRCRYVVPAAPVNRSLLTCKCSRPAAVRFNALVDLSGDVNGLSDGGDKLDVLGLLLQGWHAAATVSPPFATHLVTPHVKLPHILWHFTNRDFV